ncbi:MAG: hypothetical protein AAGC78_12240 [Cellvibrio sp.]|uniref:hypothetical protein n=1 Tax=Cellvibrio sp. TaxID=1965322 RepID=UPI0031B3AEDE
MELIDRYIYAVGQGLPESRRDEITRELRANILDKLEAISEEQGRAPNDAEVAEVLKALGHPQKVAGSFSTAQQLVSAELFPVYKRSLHYGLILVFILALIQLGVHLLNSGNLAISNFLYEIVQKGLIMFASVTGVFYLLSNPVGGKPYFDPYKCWAPEKLPPVTRGWQRISACEQSVDFTADLFFLLLLNYTLWIPSGQLANLTIAFSEPVQQWTLLLSAIVIVSLLFGVWKLIYRYWTPATLVLEAVINVAIAIPLLLISRIKPLVVDTSSTQEHLEALKIGNDVIGMGLFWVGIWLIFMAGWSIYRAWQISR